MKAECMPRLPSAIWKEGKRERPGSMGRRWEGGEGGGG